MFWLGTLIAQKHTPATFKSPLSTPPSLQERVRAAFLSFAIGDALGATVEFLTPREIQQKHGVHRDMLGGGWLRLKPGQVTDDTTMSLALSQAILEHGTVDALIAAQAFDQWMRGKPVDIGNTVRRNLITFRKTGNPEAPASEHDAGNGAAMRCLPIALATYGHPPEIIQKASAAQAHVTHHNPLSDAACETLINMLHALFDGASLIETERHAQALVQRFPVFDYQRKRIENPSGYIVDTVQAVFQAVFTTNTLENCLIDVVNRGGDADTTGAIAGMLAGAHYGEAAIPKRWVKTLDAGLVQRLSQHAESLTLNSPGLIF